MATVTLILLILLLMLALGALPLWPYNRSWGYQPGNMLSVALVLMVVIVVVGGSYVVP